MGMDILSKYRRGGYLHYSLSGWATLLDYLEKWGIDLSEFTGLNDGDLINPKTCEKVAHALADHWDELNAKDQAWLYGHPIEWHKMAEDGGAEQVVKRR